MKSFKKTSYSLALLFGFLAAKTVLAADAFDRLQTAGGVAKLPTTDADPQRIIANVVVYALGFVGLLFLGSVIFAGWQWMSSGGNEENISKAKKRLVSSIIGIAVVASAYTVTLFVSDAIYKATCSGGYYCPPALPQATGDCSVDSDCRQQGEAYACSKQGNCLIRSCAGGNGDDYCHSVFGDQYFCRLVEVEKIIGPSEVEYCVIPN